MTEALVNTGLKRVVGGITVRRLGADRAEYISRIDGVRRIICVLEQKAGTTQSWITGGIGDTSLLPGQCDWITLDRTDQVPPKRSDVPNAEHHVGRKLTLNGQVVVQSF